MWRATSRQTGRPALSRRRNISGAAVLVVAALCVLAGEGLGKFPAGLSWRFYAVFATAVVLFLLVRALQSPADSHRTRQSGASESGGSQAPPELQGASDTLQAARFNQIDFDNRLRPLLREIAAEALQRRGLSLERDPEQAREMLGEGAELILGDVASSIRGARGPGAGAISGLLARLEQLQR